MPIVFVNWFRKAFRRSPNGHFGDEPFIIEPGDKIGVVLMSIGGAEHSEDVEAALSRRLLTSRTRGLPLPALLRSQLVRFAARRRAKTIRTGYEQIGGTCPQSRRTREQATALQKRLNAQFREARPATFRTYTTTLSASDCLRRTRDEVLRDAIDKVVLLPLYPQYSHSTTGALLDAWRAIEVAERSTKPLPSNLVSDFAEHPHYVRAISERIDEALQRFPQHIRGDVPLVFAAPARPHRYHVKKLDPFDGQFHATVRSVMDFRGPSEEKRPFHIALRRKHGGRKLLVPSLDDTLERLIEDGQSSVLIVPAAEVSDRVETVHGLDIVLRDKASALGFDQMEVTEGLNSHTLFIDALAESVMLKLRSVATDPVVRPLIIGDQSVGVDVLLAAERKSDLNQSKAA